MKTRILILLAGLLAFACPARAQIVGQGDSNGGSSPWHITFGGVTQPVDCVSGCTPGGSFADNGTFTFGTTSIANMGIVFDDVAPNALTENHAGAPRGSANRSLYIQLRDGLGNERGAAVNAANQLSATIGDIVGVESAVTVHSESLQIGGTTSPGGEWHAATVTNTTPGGLSAYGLVVRDPSALVANSGALNATGLETMAYSRSDSAMHVLESRESTPLGTEYALLVRNIPSGAQTTSNYSPAPTTGTITGSDNNDCSTATACVIATGMSNMGSALIMFSNNYTFATDAALVEVSIDGTFWAAMAVTDATTNHVLGSGSAFGFFTPNSAPWGLKVDIPGGATQLRVRNTQPLVGGQADISIAASSDPMSYASKDGQQVMSRSLPVVIASNQSAVPTSVSSLPLPSGASTSALQTTGNTSLASIKTNTDPFVNSAAGGYVRQDSTGTIAKETGGNLATIATNTGSIDSKLTAPLSTVSKVALAANAPATASVGVASATALAANASRKGLVVVNVSSAKVCLAIGATAVIDSGICLQPDAVWNMNEYSFATGAINAIATAAASPVSIQEFQ